MKRTMTRGARLLCEWRKLAGLTTSKACQRMEIDQGRYNALERGRGRPGLDLAKRIEDATEGAVPMAAWTDIEPEQEGGVEAAAPGPAAA